MKIGGDIVRTLWEHREALRNECAHSNKLAEKQYLETLVASVTLQKLLLDQMTTYLTSNEKLDTPQFLELSKALSQISDTLEKSGESIRKKRGYLESL